MEINKHKSKNKMRSRLEIRKIIKFYKRSYFYGKWASRQTSNIMCFHLLCCTSPMLVYKEAPSDQRIVAFITSYEFQWPLWSVDEFTQELCTLHQNEIDRIRSLYELHRNYFERVEMWICGYNEYIRIEVCRFEFQFRSLSGIDEVCHCKI